MNNMENKKGFAIIETLITTVILTTALISLYVLFNNIMMTLYLLQDQITFLMLFLKF